MSIQENQVLVGNFYNANKNQLRKVTEITEDNEGRIRVHFLSKSQNHPGRKFEFGHPKTNPPLIDTFLQSCNTVLTPEEVAELRQNNIILSDE